MTDIKYDAVFAGIIDTMQRYREFHSPKIRSQMASCPGNILYNHIPQFVTQLGELLFRNLLYICGIIYCI
jgi:hypothetical protein